MLGCVFRANSGSSHFAQMDRKRSACLYEGRRPKTKALIDADLNMRI